jgi:hypothetical protein
MGEEDGLEDEGDRVASNDKQGKKGGRLPGRTKFEGEGT